MAEAAKEALPEIVTFCCNFKGAQITVHGTAWKEHTPMGVRDHSDEIIKFKNGKYKASRKRKYLLRGDYDENGNVKKFPINEVDYLLQSDFFTQGVGGVRIWVQKGNEDLLAALERMEMKLGPNEPPVPLEQKMAVMKSLIEVEKRIEAQEPGAVEVIHGVRASRLPNEPVDPPDPFDTGYDPASQAEGLTPFQEKFRTVVK